MNPEFDLEFRTLGKERSVQVAMTNLLDISDDGLDLHTVMDVDTYFVPLFDVRITLPADFEVTAATVGGAPVEWSIASGEAGVIEVRLPLDPPQKPGETRRVTLTAHADPEDWPVDRDAVLLPFPQVGLPQANMVEARYGIMADADLDVPDGRSDRPRPGPSGRRAQFAAGGPGAGPGVAARLQLSGHGLLRPVGSHPQADEAGGLDAVAVAARSAERPHGSARLRHRRRRRNRRTAHRVAGDRPEPTCDSSFRRQNSEPVAIVEQTVSDPVNGQRTWALRFDRRMRGNHLVQVSLVQPRAEGKT